jgi:ribosomal protein S18 acetylase RimI-like enzyme
MATASAKPILQTRSWTKDQYLVSTDHDLVPISALIEVFNSREFYWANAMPQQAMQEMLEKSMSFGLYEQQESKDLAIHTPVLKFIGIARCVTDFVTFAYLTDVWVDPVFQGKGLGSWLVQCVQEVLEAMPHLRRTILFTADWERSVPFYQKLMGMTVVEIQKGEGLALMESKGKGHPTYGREGSGY